MKNTKYSHGRGRKREMPKQEKEKRQLGLIRTKLIPLKPVAVSIDRSDLFTDLLDPASQRNIVSVVAAAGSGKSVLMGQFNQAVDQQGWLTCWISLDKDDDNISLFLSYFLAALAEIDPDLGKRAFQLNQLQLTDGVDGVFKTLCEDLSALTKPAVIFFDDFQHITDFEILSGINRLITALPANFKLVLASRSSLPLDLIRKKMEGGLLEIGQSELNFSSPQTDQFLLENHNLELKSEEICEVIRTTEGWAAGLQLAAIALKNASENKTEIIQRLSNRNTDIATYLMEVVFNRLDDNVKAFLLGTAPLSRMNASLCTHLLGEADSENMLSYMMEKNLFLIPLDEKREWFRYHHLFSDFLVEELKKQSPDKFASICQKASGWFEENNYTTEAIQYLLAAESYEKAADLIAEKSTHIAQFMGDHRTMLDWVRRLPEAFHYHHPLIMLNYAWSHIFTHSGEVGRKIAKDIREKLLIGNVDKWTELSEGLDSAVCLADVILAISYACDDLCEEAEIHARQALAKWPDTGPTYKGALNNVIAYCCISNLEFDKGVEAATKARVFGVEAKAEYITAWADWITAVNNIKMGLLNEAELHLQQNVEAPNRFGGGADSHAYILHSILAAELYCDRGDYKRARDLLGDKPQVTSVMGSMEPLLVFHKVNTRVLMAEGRHEEALAGLRKAQEDGLVSQTPRISIFLAAEEIKILIRLSRIKGARSIAKRWGGLGGENIYEVHCSRPVTEQMRQLIESRLLIAEGNYKEALNILMGLLGHAKSVKRGRILIELIVMRSVALWHLDRKNEALRAIANATSLASEEKLAAPFLEASTNVKDLLDTLVQQRSKEGVGHLEQAIAFEKQLWHEMMGTAAETPLASSMEHDKVQEHFTERELDILRLLGEGLSNAELADLLLVTIPTIKWHLNNVYSKLNVKNRMAAVVKAKKMGLV